jgi:hypothetical protein
VVTPWIGDQGDRPTRNQSGKHNEQDGQVGDTERTGQDRQPRSPGQCGQHDRSPHLRGHMAGIRSERVEVAACKGPYDHGHGDDANPTEQRPRRHATPEQPSHDRGQRDVQQLCDGTLRHQPRRQEAPNLLVKPFLTWWFVVFQERRIGKQRLPRTGHPARASPTVQHD